MGNAARHPRVRRLLDRSDGGIDWNGWLQTHPADQARHYPLATLTVHNLLKELTYASREPNGSNSALLGWNADDRGTGTGVINASHAGYDVRSPVEVQALIGKLSNLREANDPARTDTMGPWYHLYGVLFVGSVTTGTEATLGAWSENSRRSTSAFSGRAFPDDIIALAVRWYVRYRLSYAEVSEWLAERGVLVDQSTIYRWVQPFLPLFGEVARKYRHPVGPDWRVDETYARIRGRWHYIYRAIDGHGQIVDAYVSPTRDTVAARRFFERAVDSSGTTRRRVITDKAASYPPALAAVVPDVLHRTGRYRTNGIERDHGFPSVSR